MMMGNNGELCMETLRAKNLCVCFQLLHWNCQQNQCAVISKKGLFSSQDYNSKLPIVVQLMMG